METGDAALNARSFGVEDALMEDSMADQFVETWDIHDRINRYLLKAVPDDALGSALGPKHRTAYQLFAHLHNVRLMWLKSAAPEL